MVGAKSFSEYGSGQAGDRLIASKPAHKGSVVVSGQRVLFLSHAALDKDLAMQVKASVEESFPSVTVFATTDPEALPPGDAWVKTIFKNLRKAEIVCVLGTERGLTRKWVWLETGAGWARFDRILTCCVGAMRKSNLPAPFSWFTALNIDTTDECRAFFDLLKARFGQAAKEHDYGWLAAELTRLDVRVAEKHRLQTTVKYAPEIRAQAELSWRRLDPIDVEALRVLFLLGGKATDHQVLTALVDRRVQSDGRTKFFERIWKQTGFVDRLWEYNQREHVYGYEGPWRLNPTFESILEDYVFNNAAPAP